MTIEIFSAENFPNYGNWSLLLKFFPHRLRDSGLLLRFVTNTTKESKRLLLNRLSRVGLGVREDEAFTCLSATRRVIDSEGLRPMLLLDEAAMEDFEVCHGPSHSDGLCWFRFMDVVCFDVYNPKTIAAVT